MTVKYHMDVDSFRETIAIHVADIEKRVWALTGLEEILSTNDASIESSSLQPVLAAILGPMAETLSTLKSILDRTTVVPPGSDASIVVSVPAVEDRQ